jgi:hypothetical protein
MILEILKLITPFLVLAATWFVGQRILVSWDMRKKRQELDIAAATQFQQLYGEVKEVARLWRTITKRAEQPITPPADIRWQLLARATSVEGKSEAVVMKLATERPLSEGEIRSIGLFRQACQDLRESIRDGKSLPAMRYGGGYTLFNNLATEITCLIGRNPPKDAPELQVAQKNLDAIARIGSRVWLNAVEEAEKKFEAEK